MKTQITVIRRQSGNITTDYIDSNRIIRKYEYVYAYELNTKMKKTNYLKDAKYHS